MLDIRRPRLVPLPGPRARQLVLPGPPTWVTLLSQQQ
jgi:hypothetical protein